ncbi:hypothetical protein LEP1GSC005_1296 [Leptospira santarosai str. ST188]|nr:hypothetical protein LEP1GSC005_1296 [Leptospira santarosai str. ST188]
MQPFCFETSSNFFPITLLHDDKSKAVFQPTFDLHSRGYNTLLCGSKL